MSMLEVTLADGTIHEIASGVSAGEVIRDAYGRGAVAAIKDGNPCDLSTPIEESCTLDQIPLESEDGVEILRHSCAHLLAQAVVELFPDAKPTIGPAIEHGFYYDFHMDPLGEEDLSAIQKKMQYIVKQNLKIEREEHDSDGLASLFADNQFKTEIIDEKLEAGTGSSIYRQGDFYDLCRGPHVPSTSYLRNFKLTSTSQAFWRADSSRESLVRIYGMCYATKQDLKARETLLREAALRDHRKLGKDLQLFHIDEMVGQGLILWTPRGSVVRQELQNFIGEHLRRQGYSQVFTPHIGKLDLYRTSGHFPYYQESQYPPLVERDLMAKLADDGCSCSELANMMGEGDIDGYLLKPMNCPHHCEIYKSKPRSYKDLPLRLAEFGTVYRYEQSGELHGLTRVRGFTQDDAHIFCAPEQLQDEFKKVIDIVLYVFKTFGFKDFITQVSLRDPNNKEKYIGSDENWEKAQNAIIEASAEKGLETIVEEGEAAFYGPKLDFMVKDAIGRKWQLGTIQVDYNLPERFELEYTGSDNQKHRPIMIHRAPFGSMERFVALLIEHTAGKFPLWLTPDQAIILPISEKFNNFAKKLANKLEILDIRTLIDDRNEKIGKKIREAELKRIPYMLIIGEKEEKENKVSVRKQGEGDIGSMEIDEFAKLINDQIAEETKK